MLWHEKSSVASDVSYITRFFRRIIRLFHDHATKQSGKKSTRYPKDATEDVWRIRTSLWRSSDRSFGRPRASTRLQWQTVVVYLSESSPRGGILERFGEGFLLGQIAMASTTVSSLNARFSSSSAGSGQTASRSAKRSLICRPYFPKFSHATTKTSILLLPSYLPIHHLVWRMSSLVMRDYNWPQKLGRSLKSSSFFIRNDTFEAKCLENGYDITYFIYWIDRPYNACINLLS